VGVTSASGEENASYIDSSGDSPPESRKQRKTRTLDHRELLRKLPGAKSVTFLPLYANAEEKMVAGCFLWTHVVGLMRHLDEDLAYLRAFGNCIMSEIAQVNMQKNEAAKTTFIASMSHELRSPLHGSTYTHG
jgi:signal transduction histidine kinase